MHNISLLGCGWLGLPLAERLIEKGFTIKGSTTSIEKIPLLKDKGILPFLIALREDAIEGNIKDFLEHSELLIIDIPPRLRGAIKEDFTSKIEILVAFIRDSSIKKVLFISSTSVYSDQEETITEGTIPLPDTESGRQLLASESLLQNEKSFETTILRFGGLIGEDRHPVKHLAGKNNIENPEGFINMIHREDCIGIIARILETESWGTTFNAVAPFHPTRKDYYTQKAKAMGLEQPLFSNEKSSRNKIIDASKIATELNYTFVRKDDF